MKIRLLNTNQHSEAICTLYSLREQLLLLDLKVYRWKWIIIILHNCLQNFMICCLTGSNYLGVLNKDSSIKWYKFLLTPFTEAPKIYLDDCIMLFKKIQSKSMLKNVQSKMFTATESHKYAVKKMNELRNNFIHFIPKDWTIVIGGLPDITQQVIEIIEFLAFKSGNYQWESNREKEHCKNVIEEIKNKLILIRESY